MKTLYFFTLTLSGVLTQDNDWNVIYPNKSICAVRGLSVSLPCTYFYPQNVQVVRKLWCSLNSNTEYCINPPHVYDSTSHTESDFQFTGDNKSDCTLLIHDLKLNYSGEYRFRFLSKLGSGRFTGIPGVTLQVTDLKVSLSRISGNGTFKPGDSLNLTCDVNCTHTSSQFLWSKNNEPLNTPGPVLHFRALTARDSGNYTCTWRSSLTSGSETISLQIEDEDFNQGLIWIIILVVVLVIVMIVVVVAAVTYHKRKRDEALEENIKKSSEKSQVEENTLDKQPKPQQSDVPQQGDVTVYNEEVTYASVSIKDKKQLQGRAHADRQKEDDSVIYSTVIHT